MRALQQAATTKNHLLGQSEKESAGNGKSGCPTHLAHLSFYTNCRCFEVSSPCSEAPQGHQPPGLGTPLPGDVMTTVPAQSTDPKHPLPCVEGTWTQVVLHHCSLVQGFCHMHTCSPPTASPREGRDQAQSHCSGRLPPPAPCKVPLTLHNLHQVGEQSPLGSAQSMREKLQLQSGRRVVAVGLAWRCLWAEKQQDGDKSIARAPEPVGDSGGCHIIPRMTAT